MARRGNPCARTNRRAIRDPSQDRLERLHELPSPTNPPRPAARVDRPIHLRAPRPLLASTAAKLSMDETLARATSIADFIAISVALAAILPNLGPRGNRRVRQQGAIVLRRVFRLTPPGSGLHAIGRSCETSGPLDSRPASSAGKPSTLLPPKFARKWSSTR